jgi:hypothetical protein
MTDELARSAIESFLLQDMLAFELPSGSTIDSELQKTAKSMQAHVQPHQARRAFSLLRHSDDPAKALRDFLRAERSRASSGWSKARVLEKELDEIVNTLVEERHRDLETILPVQLLGLIGSHQPKLRKLLWLAIWISLIKRMANEEQSESEGSRDDDQHSPPRRAVQSLRNQGRGRS